MFISGACRMSYVLVCTWALCVWMAGWMVSVMPGVVFKIEKLVMDLMAYLG
jgi:hypothetical protein